MALDANGCLTNKTDALTTINGVTMVPQCCVVALPDNSCAFRCELSKY